MLLSSLLARSIYKTGSFWPHWQATEEGLPGYSTLIIMTTHKALGRVCRLCCGFTVTIQDVWNLTPLLTPPLEASGWIPWESGMQRDQTILRYFCNLLSFWPCPIMPLSCSKSCAAGLMNFKYGYIYYIQYVRQSRRRTPHTLTFISCNKVAPHNNM